MCDSCFGTRFACTRASRYAPRGRSKEKRHLAVLLRVGGGLLGARFTRVCSCILMRSRGVCCKAEKRHLTACFRFFVGLGESLWHKIHSLVLVHLDALPRGRRQSRRQRRLMVLLRGGGQDSLLWARASCCVSAGPQQRRETAPSGVVKGMWTRFTCVGSCILMRSRGAAGNQDRHGA